MNIGTSRPEGTLTAFENVNYIYFMLCRSIQQLILVTKAFCNIFQHSKSCRRYRSFILTQSIADTSHLHLTQERTNNSFHLPWPRPSAQPHSASSPSALSRSRSSQQPRLDSPMAEANPLSPSPPPPASRLVTPCVATAPAPTPTRRIRPSLSRKWCPTRAYARPYTWASS